MVISDAYLTSLISDLSKQIEDLNVVEILKMFPEAAKITDMMTIDKVAQVMPEVTDRYEKTRPITARFNPKGLI